MSNGATGDSAYGGATSDVIDDAGGLEGTARRLAGLGSPVVVFCAAHSGSRLLTQALQRLGIFMGSHLNYSDDSVDIFDLVRYLVENHAPSFTDLFVAGDADLEARAVAAFTAHLKDRPDGQRWGWKLPETTHVIPVIARLFPGALFIHLVRDGRDVAFSPFVAPKSLFWRKIYFNDDRIYSWCGLPMSQRAYRDHGHLFNAARWVTSVNLGRAYGAMLGRRCLEVRYEAIVANPAAEIARIAAFVGTDVTEVSTELPYANPQSVGKWRQRPVQQLDEVRAILEPTLGAFGYEWHGPASLADTALRVADWTARLLKRDRFFGGHGVLARPRAEPKQPARSGRT